MMVAWMISASRAGSMTALAVLALQVTPGADATVQFLQSAGLIGAFVLFVGLLLSDRLMIGSQVRLATTQLESSHQRELAAIAAANAERTEMWTNALNREIGRAERAETTLLQAFGLTGQTIDRTTALLSQTLAARGQK